MRCQQTTQYSAFISSITSCIFDLSKSFPQHIQTGGPEYCFDFYGFTHISKKLDENSDDLVVEPSDKLTEAIFSTASCIAESSEDKIFSLSDLNNVNSIINKLLNTLKNINYNDPDSYNHFHDTITNKPNQLQSHLYNTMSQTWSDDITQIMYNNIPTNEIHNNKNFFFQQLSCLTANQSNIAGSFLTSTSQSFYNKFSNKEFSTLLCLRYNLEITEKKN